jgi:hypothetical protein
MPTLPWRHVNLDPLAKVEQALGACPCPGAGIEGCAQCSGRDPAFL